MKKIVFKQVYMCVCCSRKIVGYTANCPICKDGGKVVKTKEDKIVTLIKGNNK